LQAPITLVEIALCACRRCSPRQGRTGGSPLPASNLAWACRTLEATERQIDALAPACRQAGTSCMGWRS